MNGVNGTTILSTVTALTTSGVRSRRASKNTTEAATTQTTMRTTRRSIILSPITSTDMTTTMHGSITTETITVDTILGLGITLRTIAPSTTECPMMSASIILNVATLASTILT